MGIWHYLLTKCHGSTLFLHQNITKTQFIAHRWGKRKSYLFRVLTKHKFKALITKYRIITQNRNFRSCFESSISIPTYKFQFFFTVAELMMSTNSGFKEAPPTKNPSMSGCDANSLLFPPFTEPAVLDGVN